MASLSQAAAKACRSLLDAKVIATERPGGRSRESIRVRLDDGSVFATKRKYPGRAVMEAKVLETLHARGAPVPRLIAFDGDWLIQEDLGGQRLSQSLAEADPPALEILLDTAIASLATIHREGQAAGLTDMVRPIGTDKKWLRQFLETPRRIGRYLGLPAPELPFERLTERLAVEQPEFVKWDARPGNAVRRDDQSVAWFDWEHCGSRRRVDDLAWLLADEYLADRPDMEERLLSKHLADFCGPQGLAETHDYLHIFGSLHACIRLGLILSRKADGDWWDADYCLAGDKVGVTPEAALRCCRRAARWSKENDLIAAIAPWLDEVAQKIETLD